MYDFLDRPLGRLAPGGRFLLYAARGWIHAATAGGCPPGMLAPAFARHGVLAALPHFHTLLAELNRRALAQISFAPLGHARIAEDEAIFLQLCRDASAAPPRARATLALLVEEEAVSPAFVALLAAMARLGDGGLGDIARAEGQVARPH
jgi:hypothetical protein